jgi:CMP-N,N'-diacetyllegionaminic acid synthase
MRDVLAIIPARGGSKGIPRKNLADCGGRPLVDWVIEAANTSRRLSGAVLSSDDRDILQRAWGDVLPLRRPAELATDEASTESVLAHAIEVAAAGADVFVLLQPTSPLTRGKHIDEAIDLLISSGADSVVSVVPSHSLHWLDGKPLYNPLHRPRRQDMRPLHEENGAIYVFTRELWERGRCRLGGKVELYVMPEQHRLQVDSPADLELASSLLRRELVPA